LLIKDLENFRPAEKAGLFVFHCGQPSSGRPAAQGSRKSTNVEKLRNIGTMGIWEEKCSPWNTFVERQSTDSSMCGKFFLAVVDISYSASDPSGSKKVFVFSAAKWTTGPLAEGPS